jgi:hypothetical protein
MSEQDACHVTTFCTITARWVTFLTLMGRLAAAIGAALEFNTHVERSGVPDGG